MQIIQITPMENGAHRNQATTSAIQIPDGWAVVPDSVTIPDTFPFVDLTVEDGTVVAMAPGIVPEPDLPPEEEPTLEEQLVAAYREGVASA